MKNAYKLGEIIETNENLKIKRTISGNIETLPKESKLLVTRNGFKVLSGECRGVILPLNDKEIKGTDYPNISKLIYQRLNGVFGLGMLLEDEEIEQKEFLEEIEDILIDIL